MKIYINPDDKKNYFGIFGIKKELLEIWYNEMTRRLIQAEWERFDVDEAFETWEMSLNHFNEMINFLNK